MGCGLCTPRPKASSVSPSAQSVGKAFKDGEGRARTPRPDSWRAREAPEALQAREAREAPEAPESPKEVCREGPRAAADSGLEVHGVPTEAPCATESAELPGMLEEVDPKATLPVAEVLPSREVSEDTAYREVPAEVKLGAETTSTKSLPRASHDEDSDDSVDEEEVEATLRAVAEVLTPRRNSEAKLEVPKPPPKTGERKTSRPLYEITSPMAVPQMAKPQVASPIFPNVPVSTSTQLLLLTWARWGRNICRIKQEEHIKSLQHKRFPRSPPPVQLSPQPTPRAQEGSPSSSPGNSPGRLRTGAAAWRAGGEMGMGTTVHSREGGSPGRAFDLAELREEQRDSMAQQGTRARLTRGLGVNAAQAHSLGTPGFGVDTPGFPGGSNAASADASVASSGVASPVKGGQMSPWILEAEALCEETEDETSPGGGWGLEPETDTLLVLEQELFGRTEPTPKESLKEDQPVLDEDELERVEVFEGSPSRKSEAESTEVPAVLADARPQEMATSFEYMVGEKVSYYSSSHRAWMPARVVERKSRTVYVIDKQLRGCLAKVKASELVSESEERSNPVLRAFTMLEKSERKRPSSASSTRASSKTPSPTPPSPVALPNKGRIVRDDFSDDSDG